MDSIPPPALENIEQDAMYARLVRVRIRSIKRQQNLISLPTVHDRLGYEILLKLLN